MHDTCACATSCWLRLEARLDGKFVEEGTRNAETNETSWSNTRWSFQRIVMLVLKQCTGSLDNKKLNGGYGSK